MMLARTLGKVARKPAAFVWKKTIWYEFSGVCYWRSTLPLTSFVAIYSCSSKSDHRYRPGAANFNPTL